MDHVEPTGHPAPAPARLVDVSWLQAHLDDPDVRAVEVGPDATAYYSGHVPCAVAVSWLDDLNDRDRRGLPGQEHLERLLERKGITPDTHVVLYGDEDNTFAAYTYWVLRYYQHRSVSLLDGGRRAWSDAGGPLVQDVPTLPATCYRSPGPDPDLRATRDQVLERYVGGPPGTAVLDCRSPAEYAGRPSTAVDLPVMRHRLGGHVPAARNLPHTDLLDADTGRFRPCTELREQFTGAGVDPDDDIVLYCDVGGRSSLGWFVLHELLGYPQVRNYDGGWAEYGSLAGAPVER